MTPDAVVSLCQPLASALKPPAAAGGDMQIPADTGEQVSSPVLVVAKDFDIEVLVMPGGAA